ncbi:sugar transferase [Gordonibacter urolithinfaciens]|uniref:Sugar transferase n=1 Tax=Gordonibacter urolithinfaciens TaxID=1335613 RepID=A0A423UJ33_9ACTN|nr:sugar transferase [Gordonibacter urolithinfaciens]MBS6974889.1 sugar transferase [Eggerthellaceae bacterium]MCB6562345.1 sugar transferase [Gordonibacter urolithinfaciens]MCB7086554.1 sugar transferase [Gordonibacter urolithinfaciens]MSA95418.1 sugar transferase [Gordonibacter urolithinfaciens]ROT89265.1 sugar transferase [Gordonibacter urolithinfaciens]
MTQQKTTSSSNEGSVALACEETFAPLPELSDAEVTKRNRARLGYRAAKRAFDIAFSAVVLAALMVPGLVLALAISLDSPGGPVFRQERVGRGGRPMRIFKFRSMRADAHEHPERYLDEAQLAAWRREQKVEGDPRVTRLGRFIRKTSIDEFPQLVNVLMGDMSVVGPRPVTEAETHEFGEHRDLALSVRPGVTGLWQVTERNEATWENGDRQRIELEYVRRCGLRMDAGIVVGTLGAMARKTGR